MNTLDLFRQFSVARFSTASWLWLLAVAVLLTACGGGGSSDSTNPNSCGVGDCSPQARITTPAVTTIYAGQPVQLDGSQSQPNGTLSYRWQQTAGESVTLSGTDEAIAQFVAPTFATEQTLRFKLVVTNGSSDNAEEISFVVKPLTLTATASTDTAIPGTPAELRAAGGDESGELQYLWEQINVGDVALLIEDANNAIASITSRIVTAATTATFRVTVTNKYNATAQSEVTINLAEGVIPSITAVTPSYAAVGEEVKISGSGFTGVLAVNLQSSIQSIDVPFTVYSDHEVRITVPTTETNSYTLNIQSSGGEFHENLKISAPLSDATKIAAGRDHYCAVFTEKTVSCWGSNAFGQLGNGSTTSSSHPVKVITTNGDALSEVVRISAGLFHTCALRIDHTVWCWGRNDHDQLAEDFANIEYSSNAKLVAGLTNDIVDVESGFNHACTLSILGEIRCWGLNNYGQTGTSNEGHVAAPTIASPDYASSIALGAAHSCALFGAEKNMKCWGSNTYGQLGDNSTTGSTTPTAVKAESGTGTLQNVASISAGGSQSCAVLSNGTARCWGANSHGQLGTGDQVEYHIPTRVKGADGDEELANVAKLEIGQGLDRQTTFSNPGNLQELNTANRTCALLNDGQVSCWGDNYHGQLGNGSLTNSNRPAPVSNLDNVTELAMSRAGACAISQDSRVRCWGINANGMLGRNEIGAGSRPTIVEGISDASAITSGGIGLAKTASFSCALSKEGLASCWGHNNKGQLGTGSSDDSWEPTPIGLTKVTSLSSGGTHSCAVSLSKVYCWGLNDKAQIGDYNADYKNSPQLISGLPEINSVSSGLSHNCAVAAEGDIYCWGNNSSWQTSSTSTSPLTFPIKVQNLPGKATEVSAGAGHTCALLESGDVYCWGSNFAGELGVENNIFALASSSPIKVSLPVGVTATEVTAGVSHSCAVTNDGSTFCWGGNSNGQLGNGSTTSIYTPATAMNLIDTTSVSASGSTIYPYSYGLSCAVLAENNGSASCWGTNDEQNLGANVEGDQAIPVQISGLFGIKQIAAGGTHSCALYHDGYVACWGGDYGGQLGQQPPPPLPVLQ